MTRETIARLAAYGAFAAVGGLLAIYAWFLFITYPDGQGIDVTEAIVGAISVGLVIVALVVVHLAFARTLLAMARGQAFGV